MKAMTLEGRMDCNAQDPGRTSALHGIQRPWKNACVAKTKEECMDGERVDCKDLGSNKQPGRTQGLRKLVKSACSAKTKKGRIDCTDPGRTHGLQRPRKNAWTAKTK